MTKHEQYLSAQAGRCSAQWTEKGPRINDYECSQGSTVSAVSGATWGQVPNETAACTRAVNEPLTKFSQWSLRKPLLEPTTLNVDANALS